MEKALYNYSSGKSSVYNLILTINKGFCKTEMSYHKAGILNVP